MSDKPRVEDAEAISIDVTIVPGSNRFDENTIERLLESIMGLIEQSGYQADSGYGVPESDHRSCIRCFGTGVELPIPDDYRCPTCDGMGIIEPQVESSSSEEWQELYGEDENLKKTELSAEKETAGTDPEGC